ncbi:hypothetical protein BASA81_012101 [Batrachochytrium salamandrivorans]|nr:hypothetical protein BASA81_012101 [Batrachochytrium salamandrivorans]
MDSMTPSAIKARAMWYPDCHNIGTLSAPKSMYFRLRAINPAAPAPVAFIPNPVPTHQLAITMALDSSYEILVDGLPGAQPLNPTSGQNVTTWTKTVLGNGPWVIAISGHNVNTLGGLFAYVTLDGIPYTTTATLSNRFRMTPNTPGAGWTTDPAYDDSTWFTQTIDTCHDYSSIWSSLLPAIDALVPSPKARSMWYPDCYNNGTPAAPVNMYFRLLVTSPQGAPIVFVPNPVPSHVLGITIDVDDNYDLLLDNQPFVQTYSLYSYQNVSVYSKIVYGDGPWLISVHGYDIGNIAGLFAVVTLDGVPFSTTATSTNRFRMTPNTLVLDGTLTSTTTMLAGSLKISTLATTTILHGQIFSHPWMPEPVL